MAALHTRRARQHAASSTKQAQQVASRRDPGQTSPVISRRQQEAAWAPARTPRKLQSEEMAPICGLTHPGGATSSPRAWQRTRRWRGAIGRAVSTGTYTVPLIMVCGTARAGSASQRAVGPFAKTGRLVVLQAIDLPSETIMSTAADGLGVPAEIIRSAQP